jgi:hypothetical protein
VCSLWGTDWILKYFKERLLQRVKFVEGFNRFGEHCICHLWGILFIEWNVNADQEGIWKEMHVAWMKALEGGLWGWCCSCWWSETMSLNCSHQRAYRLSLRSYMSMETRWNDIDRETEENPVPVPLLRPQISHGLTQTRAVVSAVRVRLLTTWAMTRPKSVCYCRDHGHVTWVMKCVIPIVIAFG